MHVCMYDNEVSAQPSLHLATLSKEGNENFAVFEEDMRKKLSSDDFDTATESLFASGAACFCTESTVCVCVCVCVCACVRAREREGGNVRVKANYKITKIISKMK